MSDTSHYIGKTHTEDLGRDAIHIAVAQVIANENMLPGDALEFIDDKLLGVKTCPMNKGIGIVDPFLNEEVKIGSKFFMFLYPNTVTSLSHHWTHPAFTSKDDKEEAEKWLKRVLNEDIIFDDFDEYNNFNWVVDAFKRGEDFSYLRGDEASEFLNKSWENKKKFWDNLEILTGVKATEQQRNREYFSCSC